MNIPMKTSFLAHATGLGRQVLQTCDLSIGYRTKHSVREVASHLNLNLAPGEFVCLLGPNGAGKSTLIRTLAGIQKPLAGATEIDGVDVFRISKRELARRISLVLTDRVNAGNFSVYTLLTLGRYPYLDWFGILGKQDERIIADAITATGIEKFVDKNIFDLSDGERQKVMIARALVQDTPLIILDEPTAHLDMPNRVEIMRLLRAMVRKTGKSVIMSTHELDLALQSADHIWLMMPGEALVSGTAEDLILDGTFERAFQRKGFDFCRETGSFKVNAPHGDKRIALCGEGVCRFWTKRALEREGYEIREEAPFTVWVDDAGVGSWSLECGDERHRFPSVQSLLLHLRGQRQSSEGRTVA